MMNRLLHNGEFETDSILLSPSCNGFRYGLGLFETMRVSQGLLRLADLHYNRLMSGIALLQVKPPQNWTFEYFAAQVSRLSALFPSVDELRVRLNMFSPSTSFPGDSETLEWIMQASPLSKDYLNYNIDGLHICTFHDGLKSTGAFSNLKSNNYLLSVLAAKHARKNQCHDAILLNSLGRVAETSVANLFAVFNNTIVTPPLSEGPVDGVMRKHLIDHANQLGIQVQEAMLSITDLENAQEIFLTNALYGIRWVEVLNMSKYGNKISSSLYQQLF